MGEGKRRPCERVRKGGAVSAFYSNARGRSVSPSGLTCAPRNDVRESSTLRIANWRRETAKTEIIQPPRIERDRQSESWNALVRTLRRERAGTGLEPGVNSDVNCDRIASTRYSRAGLLKYGAQDRTEQESVDRSERV